jgi:hypothetical protein
LCAEPDPLQQADDALALGRRFPAWRIVIGISAFSRQVNSSSR